MFSLLVSSHGSVQRWEAAWPLPSNNWHLKTFSLLVRSSACGKLQHQTFKMQETAAALSRDTEVIRPIKEGGHHCEWEFTACVMGLITSVGLISIKRRVTCWNECLMSCGERTTRNQSVSHVWAALVLSEVKLTKTRLQHWFHTVFHVFGS